MKIREITYKYGKCIEVPDEAISTPQIMAEVFRKYCSPVKETFVAMFLDSKNRPVGWEIISIGTVNQTIVHPREVFRGAIMSGANSLIVAHNHPSGEDMPSSDDIKTTELLKECSEIIGITLLDHVIVGKGFYSFRENGRL